MATPKVVTVAAGPAPVTVAQTPPVKAFGVANVTLQTTVRGSASTQSLMGV